METSASNHHVFRSSYEAPYDPYAPLPIAHGLTAVLPPYAPSYDLYHGSKLVTRFPVSSSEFFSGKHHVKPSKDSSVHRNPYETHDAYDAIRTQDADLAVSFFNDVLSCSKTIQSLRLCPLAPSMHKENDAPLHLALKLVAFFYSQKNFLIIVCARCELPQKKTWENLF